jgi:hypothetical protein
MLKRLFWSVHRRRKFARFVLDTLYRTGLEERFPARRLRWALVRLGTMPSPAIDTLEVAAQAFVAAFQDVSCSNRFEIEERISVCVPVSLRPHLQFVAEYASNRNKPVATAVYAAMLGRTSALSVVNLEVRSAAWSQVEMDARRRGYPLPEEILAAQRVLTANIHYRDIESCALRVLVAFSDPGANRPEKETVFHVLGDIAKQAAKAEYREQAATLRGLPLFDFCRPVR